MSLIRQGVRLLLEKSQVPSHERNRWAAICFIGLWVLYVVGSILDQFLITGLQGLIVFNYAASLTGTVVARALTASGTAAADDVTEAYPFCFGLYRVRGLLCLAGTIFVAFGCLTTVVEGFHAAMHTHYRSPLMLLALSVAHTALLAKYGAEVLAADRISGRPANRYGVCPDDEALFREAVSVPLRVGTVGGGGMNLSPGGQLGNGAGASLGLAPPSPSVYGASRKGRVSCIVSLVSRVRLFIGPTAGLTCGVLVTVTHSTLPDKVLTLALAAYYLSVAFQQGKVLVWYLTNSAVRDPAKSSAIDRALRSVQLLDGVLHVHSSAFFAVDPGKVLGFVRVRLVSDADAVAVTVSARKILLETVSDVYVECFFPNTDDEQVLQDGFGPQSRFSVRYGEERSHAHCHGHSHDDAHAHTHSHGDATAGHAHEQHRPLSRGAAEYSPGQYSPSGLPIPFPPAPESPLRPFGSSFGPAKSSNPPTDCLDRGTPSLTQDAHMWLSSPRPVSVVSGLSTQVQPLPSPPLGRGSAQRGRDAFAGGTQSLPNSVPQSGTGESGAGVRVGTLDGVTQRSSYHASASRGNSTVLEDARTGIPAPLFRLGSPPADGGAPVSSFAPAPQTDGARFPQPPPPTFTAFRPTPRTDKDV